ncbi:hypothetical protein GCM10010518_47790 [Kitasatospora cinereorecta]
MARFNTRSIRPRGTSPVESTGRTARHHQGAAGRRRRSGAVRYGSSAIAYRRGESVLKVLERFGSLGGTHTREASAGTTRGTTGC